MNPGLRVERFLQKDLWRADLSTLSPLARPGLWTLRLSVVAVREFRQGLLNLQAMGLVYTTLLSLVPFLAVTFSVLKAFGVHHNMEPILTQAFEPLGSRAAVITRRLVEFVDNLQVGVLGVLGLVALLLTVLSLFGKIEDALNQIWRVRRARSLARKFTDYLSMVLVGPVVVLAGFAVVASAQSYWLVQRILQIEPLGFIVVLATSRVMPFLFLCAAFTFMYKFIPQAEVHLTSALLGGSTAAVLWKLTGAAFGMFVASSARYTALYSSFAIGILFLVWLYVAWLIVLVGAQVAYFYQHPSTYLAANGQATHVFQERLALAALTEITRRYLSGTPPCRPIELSTALSVPLSSLEALIDEFVRRRILFRTSDPEGVSLGRPPEEVTATEILDVIRNPNDAGPLGPFASEGNVADILSRRDEVVRQSLEGVTLRTLASDGSRR